MSNNKKSAKDIAFDKERQKFQKEIKEHKENITSLNQIIQEKDLYITELRKEVDELKQSISYLNKSNCSPEELNDHIKRTKKITDMFSLLNSISSSC